MKVTISYQCDLDDVPKTIGELVSIIKRVDIPEISTEICNTEKLCEGENLTKSLASIDKVRRYLAKIDQKLMDYSTILAGYIKADTEMKMGIQPQQTEDNVSDQTDPSDSSQSGE